MQTTFIARDSSAAGLRFDRLQVAPASLSPSELLREALGLSKQKSDQLLRQLGDDLAHPLAVLRQADAPLLDAAGLNPKEITQALAVIQLARRLHSQVPECKMKATSVIE